MLIELLCAGVIMNASVTDTSSTLTANVLNEKTNQTETGNEMIPVYGRDFSYLTEDEFNSLCMLVAAEAEYVKGDDTTRFLAKEAVAETVLNRIESEKHPDNIYDVMNYPNAFSVMTNGRYGSVTPSEETINACYAALSEVKYDKDMCYFNSIGYFSWARDYTQYSNLYFSLEP